MIRFISPENRFAAQVAFTVGTLYAGGLVTYAFVFAGYEFTGEGLSVVWVPMWTLVGLFLLGSVPVYLLLRYSLVLPAAVLLLDLVVVVRAELRPTPGDPLGFQFIAWFLPFGVALLAGGVEYLVRSYLGGFTPKPLL